MTQNTEPTAGEWVFDIDKRESYDEAISVKCGDFFLASILESGANGEDEAIANAHCMAASKDMQKALEALLNAEFTDEGMDAMTMCRTALEKSKVKP